MTVVRVVTVERVIRASPAAIFDVLAEPSQHPDIDGSGTVRAPVWAPARLSLGARFGMDMRIVVPYRVVNTVVEFEEDRLIAWRHIAGHIWRYRLEPIAGGTRVTEEFDYRTSRAPWALEFTRTPQKHVPAMRATLERLAQLVGGDV